MKVATSIIILMMMLMIIFNDDDTDNEHDALEVRPLHPPACFEWVGVMMLDGEGVGDSVIQVQYVSRGARNHSYCSP
jgi:hypothetical protein